MGKDVAVLDIGSSKLVFAVGRKSYTGSYTVDSFSCNAYIGYYESNFCDISTLEDDVITTIKQANCLKMPKCLYVGVPAEFSKIETNISQMIFNRERLITSSIVNEMHSRGDVYSFDPKYSVFSSSAMFYELDGGKRVFNPVGERASQIKAYISYMFVDKEFVKMFDSIAQNAGFKEVKYVSSAWATANRFIDINARNLGAISLDVGFGTTSLSLIKGDGIACLESAPYGVASIFDKLSKQLNVDFYEALTLKNSLNLNYVNSDGAIYSLFVKNQIRSYKSIDINNSVKTRLDEIVDFINETIESNPGIVSNTTPVYLTGGGVTEIKGAVLYLEHKLKRRIRVVVVEVPKYNKPYFTSMFSLIDVAYEINENNSFWKKLF
ncbi:MAG: hypothetical protein MSH40_01280 [Christensenella sp.]|nr:hypothetical protein [Christensenella sp.]